MIIGTRGRQQGKLARIIAESHNFIATVTTGNDFHAHAAAILEFTDQAPQSCSRESIARRMRDHRLTARVGDPLHRVLQHCPFAADMSGRAAAEKVFEGFARITRVSLRDQKTREVRTSNTRARSFRLGAFQDTGNTMLGEAAADFQPARIAMFRQAREAALQRGGIGINTQPENMQRGTGPGHRDFHARHKMHTQALRHRGGRAATLRGVMIGERQHVHAVHVRAAYQLTGRERAIRMGGMAVQVIM